MGLSTLVIFFACLSTVFANDYTYIRKGCVNGANMQSYFDRTVTQCMDLCDANNACMGFEWGMPHGGSGGYRPGYCQLQSSANTAGCNGEQNNSDFYKKILANDYACLLDGAPSSGKVVAEVMNPNPDEALGEIQCCHDSNGCTRRDPWDSTSNNDCISGPNDAQKYTFQEATDMCKILGGGWTLCTQEQVHANICRSKGCSHDSALVWATCPPITTTTTTTATTTTTIEPTTTQTGLDLVRFDLVQDGTECGDRDVLELSRTTSDPTECAKLASSNPNCGKYFEVRKERSNCRCLPKQKKCAMSFDPKTTLYALQETAYLKTCRWQSTRDRLAADGEHLVGWTCAENEIITGFGINPNENDVSKIQCCDLGGHSSVIPETCSFIRVGDQEFQPERASCNANDHLMVFSGAYDASEFEDDDYTEILVGKCCEVKCDAPWCQGRDWGINTDKCLTISADAENKEAQDLVCPDGTVVTEVVDGHSGAALGIQKVASVVCCALDVISQPSSAPSLSPTTTKPTNAPSLSPSTTEPTYAPSRSPSKAPSRSPSKVPTRSPSKTPTRSPSKTPTQAPTSTAHCLLQLFQCDPPLSDAEILQGIDDCLPNCMVPSDYVVRRALEGRLLSKNAQ